MKHVPYVIQSSGLSNLQPDNKEAIVFENILQSTTVSEICKDLPLIGNSSLGNLIFSMVLEFYKLEFHGKILKIFYET